MEMETKKSASYAFFEQQLKIGHMYELMAQKRVTEYYKNKWTVTEECIDRKYDFALSNNKTYEVKADLLASKTGKIFIENIQF